MIAPVRVIQNALPSRPWPLIRGCPSKVPIGFTSRPHQHLAATSYRSCGFAAGNDAPFIGERAATGGRSGMECGDEL
jgi:hypothetical protein